MEPHERREMERQARVDQIIDAARTVFYTKNFDQATMADIERESSLTRGAIYYHFKGGKEEIYLALMDREEKELLEQFRAIAKKEKDPVKGLKAVLDAYMDAFITRQNPWKMHQQYWFIGNPDYNTLKPELVAEFAETTLNLVKVAADYVEQGMKTGQFKCKDALFEAMMIWSLITNAVHLTKENPRVPFAMVSWKEMKKQLWERVLKLVM
jgi:AcrR family transcriptional regulator